MCISGLTHLLVLLVLDGHIDTDTHREILLAKSFLALKCYVSFKFTGHKNNIWTWTQKQVFAKIGQEA